MKLLRKLIVILAVFALVFCSFSCGKDENASGIVNGGKEGEGDKEKEGGGEKEKEKETYNPNETNIWDPVAGELLISNENIKRLNLEKIEGIAQRIRNRNIGDFSGNKLNNRFEIESDIIETSVEMDDVDINGITDLNENFKLKIRAKKKGYQNLFFLGVGRVGGFNQIAVMSFYVSDDLRVYQIRDSAYERGFWFGDVEYKWDINGGWDEKRNKPDDSIFGDEYLVLNSRVTHYDDENFRVTRESYILRKTKGGKEEKYYVDLIAPNGEYNEEEENFNPSELDDYVYGNIKVYVMNPERYGFPVLSDGEYHFKFYGNASCNIILYNDGKIDSSIWPELKKDLNFVDFGRLRY